jgi:hypothetical protein
MKTAMGVWFEEARKKIDFLYLRSQTHTIRNNSLIPFMNTGEIQT